MDSVNCPFCEAENEINDLFEKGNEFDWECEECGKEFCVEVEYEPSLYASRIIYHKCDLCEKEVREVTSADVFPVFIDEVKGMMLCRECIRTVLGYS